MTDIITTTAREAAVRKTTTSNLVPESAQFSSTKKTLLIAYFAFIYTQPSTPRSRALHDKIRISHTSMPFIPCI